MGDVVIADAGSSTAIGYFEVWQSKIDTSGGGVPFGDPCPRTRGLQGGGSAQVYDPSVGTTNGTGFLLIDRGYPFMRAGNITSWLCHSLTTGTQKIGQAIFLLLRVESGNYVVRGIAPMTRDHPGPGVWEHVISPAIAVVKGDLCGLFIARDVVIGGSSIVATGYDTISALNPDRVSEGLLERNNLGAPFTIGQSCGNIGSFTQQRRRIGIQGRGLYGSQTKVTSAFQGGWYDGSGRRPFTSGTDFAVDTGVTTAQATALTNLQSSNITLGFSVAANQTGTLYWRVAAQGSLTPIEKVKLGFSTTLPANLTIQLAYSEDQSPNDGGTLGNFQSVTGWKTFATFPSDQEGTTLQQDLHLHLARKVRWLRMQVVNSSASTSGCISNFHVFGFTSQVAADGKFTYSANNIRDRMFVDSQAATMRIQVAIVANTTTQVSLSAASVAELGAIQAGDTIYLRQSGGDFFDYVVDSVNTGTGVVTVHPTGTAPGTNIAENYAVNDFVDPPVALYQIRAFTPGGVEIGRSAFLSTAGQYRERMVYQAIPGEEG